MSDSFSENMLDPCPYFPVHRLWRVIADNDDDMPSPRLSVAKRIWRFLDKWGEKIIIFGFSIYAFIRVITIIINL